MLINALSNHIIQNLLFNKKINKFNNKTTNQ